MYLVICLSMYLSTYLPIYIAICLFMYLISIYLCFYLPISIHLSTYYYSILGPHVDIAFIAICASAVDLLRLKSTISIIGKYKKLNEKKKIRVIVKISLLYWTQI